MSTTVTYKGDTLTTVNNNIKTLKTAGKYMEDDIVLVDTAAEGSQENNPIRFFDYDGTIVASYTEVPESLPPNPTHEGLTAQGWNWTLEDIATQFESTGTCDVGQMYITDDGKTRIHITVSDMTKSFWLGLAPNGTLSIDWGDGSENSSMTGTSDTFTKTVQHTYTTAGSYVISIKAESGGFAFYGTNEGYTRLLNKSESSSNYYNQPYGGCVTAIELGEGAKVYGYAFTRLFNMRSVTIPEGVTSIGSFAFQSCYAIKSITIPNGVTSIGTSAFNSCFSMESIAIPKGMTDISANTFAGCYALKSVIIPNGVINIGASSFSLCYALESITIPNTVTSIGNNVFEDCRSLKSVTIPDSITSIDRSMFQGCFAIESIIIPDTVTSIAASAFTNCFSLKSVIIPNGVTRIDNYVFASCYALGSITIPEGVTSIGSTAFRNCYNIDEYHFLPTTPPTLTNTIVFQNIQSNCKMYVPYSEDHSILEAYKTATNWSTYASYMVEEGK